MLMSISLNPLILGFVEYSSNPADPFHAQQIHFICADLFVRDDVLFPHAIHT